MDWHIKKSSTEMNVMIILDKLIVVVSQTASVVNVSIMAESTKGSGKMVSLKAMAEAYM